MKFKLFLPLVAIFVVLSSTYVQAAGINLDLGIGDKSSTSRMIQIIMAMTVLSLAPSILIMVTAFTRIIVVLSFLRTAMGAQQTPPNQVLIALAMFLTMFIMAPTFDVAWKTGVAPLLEEKITEEQAVERIGVPFHAFMLKNVRDKDFKLFANMVPELKLEKPADTPFRVLIPAFMISELRRAFEIGFLLFVPFLIIDMLVASILMAMGMMMLPPVVISLPFKIIFFVLVDGWYMVSGSLVKSFGI